MDDINSPNSRIKYWNTSQNVIKKQKITIKSLHLANKGLLEKITLNNLIDHLKKEMNLITTYLTLTYF